MKNSAGFYIDTVVNEKTVKIIEDQIIRTVEMFPPEHRTGEMGCQVFKAMIKVLEPSPVTFKDCIAYYGNGPKPKIKKRTQPKSKVK